VGDGRGLASDVANAFLETIERRGYLFRGQVGLDDEKSLVFYNFIIL
jgi:DNA-binding winged helix-turn-helix (wHTH) protein